jgi:ketosteroid isomerase-like protein
VLAAFAPNFEHRFLGEDHALAGSRTTIGRTREWYARLYRLLPDIRFELQRVAVSGPPRNTVVVVEWLEANSGADGVRTTNAGVHVVHLSWGKVTRLLICPDTTRLVATLDRLFASGNVEAHAGPITG